jgi:hypothetical protein
MAQEITFTTQTHGSVNCEIAKGLLEDYKCHPSTSRQYLKKRRCVLSYLNQVLNQKEHGGMTRKVSEKERI